MASEILVNEGGAPKQEFYHSKLRKTCFPRDALSIDTSGKVVKADADLAAGRREYMVGVALVTTA